MKTSYILTKLLAAVMLLTIGHCVTSCNKDDDASNTETPTVQSEVLVLEALELELEPHPASIAAERPRAKIFFAFMFSPPIMNLCTYYVGRPLRMKRYRNRLHLQLLLCHAMQKMQALPHKFMMFFLNMSVHSDYA